MFTAFDLFSGLLVGLIWGGNFLFARLGLDVLPPFMLLALRFFFVSLVTLPFVERTTLKFKDLFNIALTLGVIHHGLLFLSIWLKIDLSTSIIILQSSVPISSILSVYLLKERLSQKIIMGIILAFCGVVIIAGDPHNCRSYPPILISIISAISMAVFNIQTKKLGNFQVLPLIAYSSIISTIMLFLISLIFEQVPLTILLNVPYHTYISIGYMVISTVLGFGLWFRLLQRHPVSKVAPFMLMVPVFGISLTTIFMHKKITVHLIFGSIITLMGVGFITIKRPSHNMINTNNFN